ncbi:MAG: hypothetical protein ACKOTB_11125, partial [Planctomycetia bacterium]
MGRFPGDSPPLAAGAGDFLWSGLRDSGSAGDHVRVHVSFAALEGAPFETDCTVPLAIGSS